MWRSLAVDAPHRRFALVAEGYAEDSPSSVVSVPGVVTGPAVQLSAVEAEDGGLWLTGAAPGRLFGARLCVHEGSRWSVFVDGDGPPVVDAGDSLRRLPTKGWWSWDLSNAAGQVELRFGVWRLPMLVVPGKLNDGTGAVERLGDLLEDLWRRHLALSRRLGRPTGTPTGVGQRPRAPIQTLFLLQHLLELGGVAESWSAIVAEPATALVIEHPIVLREQARRPVLDGARGPWSLPGGGLIDGQPPRVRDRRAHRTADLPANRLALLLARVVEREADAAHSLLSEPGERWEGAERWLGRARAIARRAREVRSAPTLEGVDPDRPFDLSSPSLVLDRRAQPLLKAWSILAEGVGFPPHAERFFLDPLKESYDLFEYWCWFALCDAVGRALGARSDTRGGVVERVLSGERGLEHGLCWSVGDVQVSYNLRAGKGGLRSYSVPLRPDLLLECASGSVVFDAKYRRDVVKGFDEEGDVARKRRAKTDDLKVMHGYRDALRVGDRAPRWVLALYPGDEVMLFPTSGKRSKDLAVLADPVGGVGAIPVGPGKVGVLGEAVGVLIGGG